MKLAACPFLFLLIVLNALLYVQAQSQLYIGQYEFLTEHQLERTHERFTAVYGEGFRVVCQSSQPLRPCVVAETSSHEFGSPSRIYLPAAEHSADTFAKASLLFSVLPARPTHTPIVSLPETEWTAFGSASALFDAATPELLTRTSTQLVGPLRVRTVTEWDFDASLASPLPRRATLMQSFSAGADDSVARLLDLTPAPSPTVDLSALAGKATLTLVGETSDEAPAALGRKLAEAASAGARETLLREMGYVGVGVENAREMLAVARNTEVEMDTSAETCRSVDSVSLAAFAECAKEASDDRCVETLAAGVREQPALAVVAGCIVAGLSTPTPPAPRVAALATFALSTAESLAALRAVGRTLAETAVNGSPLAAESVSAVLTALSLTSARWSSMFVSGGHVAAEMTPLVDGLRALTNVDESHALAAVSSDAALTLGTAIHALVGATRPVSDGAAWADATLTAAHNDLVNAVVAKSGNAEACETALAALGNAGPLPRAAATVVVPLAADKAAPAAVRTAALMALRRAARWAPQTVFDALRTALRSDQPLVVSAALDEVRAAAQDLAEARDTAALTTEEEAEAKAAVRETYRVASNVVRRYAADDEAKTSPSLAETPVVRAALRFAERLPLAPSSTHSSALATNGASAQSVAGALRKVLAAMEERFSATASNGDTDALATSLVGRGGSNNTFLDYGTALAASHAERLGSTGLYVQAQFDSSQSGRRRVGPFAESLDVSLDNQVTGTLSTPWLSSSLALFTARAKFAASFGFARPPPDTLDSVAMPSLAAEALAPLTTVGNAMGVAQSSLTSTMSLGKSQMALMSSTVNSLTKWTTACTSQLQTLPAKATALSNALTNAVAIGSALTDGTAKFSRLGSFAGNAYSRISTMEASAQTNLHNMRVNGPAMTEWFTTVESITNATTRASTSSATVAAALPVFTGLATSTASLDVPAIGAPLWEHLKEEVEEAVQAATANVQDESLALFASWTSDLRTELSAATTMCAPSSLLASFTALADTTSSAARQAAENAMANATAVLSAARSVRVVVADTSSALEQFRAVRTAMAGWAALSASSAAGFSQAVATLEAELPSLLEQAQIALSTAQGALTQFAQLAANTYLLNSTQFASVPGLSSLLSAPAPAGRLESSLEPLATAYATVLSDTLAALVDVNGHAMSEGAGEGSPDVVTAATVDASHATAAMLAERLAKATEMSAQLAAAVLPSLSTVPTPAATVALQTWAQWQNTARQHLADLDWLDSVTAALSAAAAAATDAYNAYSASAGKSCTSATQVASSSFASSVQAFITPLRNVTLTLEGVLPLLSGDFPAKSTIASFATSSRALLDSIAEWPTRIATVASAQAAATSWFTTVSPWTTAVSTLSSGTLAGWAGSSATAVSAFTAAMRSLANASLDLTPLHDALDAMRTNGAAFLESGFGTTLRDVSDVALPALKGIAQRAAVLNGSLPQLRQQAEWFAGVATAYGSDATWCSTNAQSAVSNAVSSLQDDFDALLPQTRTTQLGELLVSLPKIASDIAVTCNAVDGLRGLSQMPAVGASSSYVAMKSDSPATFLASTSSRLQRRLIDALTSLDSLSSVLSSTSPRPLLSRTASTLSSSLLPFVSVSLPRAANDRVNASALREGAAVAAGGVAAIGEAAERVMKMLGGVKETMRRTERAHAAILSAAASAEAWFAAHPVATLAGGMADTSGAVSAIGTLTTAFGTMATFAGTTYASFFASAQSSSTSFSSISSSLSSLSSLPSALSLVVDTRGPALADAFTAGGINAYVDAGEETAPMGTAACAASHGCVRVVDRTDASYRSTGFAVAYPQLADLMADQWPGQVSSSAAPRRLTLPGLYDGYTPRATFPVSLAGQSLFAALLEPSSRRTALDQPSVLAFLTPATGALVQSLELLTPTGASFAGARGATVYPGKHVYVINSVGALCMYNTTLLGQAILSADATTVTASYSATLDISPGGALFFDASASILWAADSHEDGHADTYLHHVYTPSSGSSLPSARHRAGIMGAFPVDVTTGRLQRMMDDIDTGMPVGGADVAGAWTPKGKATPPAKIRAVGSDIRGIAFLPVSDATTRLVLARCARTRPATPCALEFWTLRPYTLKASLAKTGISVPGGVLDEVAAGALLQATVRVPRGVQGLSLVAGPSGSTELLLTFAGASSDALPTLRWLGEPIEDCALIVRAAPVLATAAAVTANTLTVTVGGETIRSGTLFSDFAFVNSDGLLPGHLHTSPATPASSSFAAVPAAFAARTEPVVVLGMPTQMTVSVDGTIGLDVGGEVSVDASAASVVLRPVFSARLHVRMDSSAASVRLALKMDGTLATSAVAARTDVDLLHAETPRLCAQVDVEAAAERLSGTMDRYLLLTQTCLPCGIACLSCTLDWGCNETVPLVASSLLPSSFTALSQCSAASPTEWPAAWGAAGRTLGKMRVDAMEVAETTVARWTVGENKEEAIAAALLVASIDLCTNMTTLSPPSPICLHVPSPSSVALAPAVAPCSAPLAERPVSSLVVRSTPLFGQAPPRAAAVLPAHLIASAEDVAAWVRVPRWATQADALTVTVAIPSGTVSRMTISLGSSITAMADIVAQQTYEAPLPSSIRLMPTSGAPLVDQTTYYAFVTLLSGAGLPSSAMLPVTVSLTGSQLTLLDGLHPTLSMSTPSSPFPALPSPAPSASTRWVFSEGPVAFFLAALPPVGAAPVREEMEVGIRVVTPGENVTDGTIMATRTIDAVGATVWDRYTVVPTQALTPGSLVFGRVAVVNAAGQQTVAETHGQIYDPVAPRVTYALDGPSTGLWQAPSDAEAQSSLTSYTMHFRVHDGESGIKAVYAALSTQAGEQATNDVVEWTQVASFTGGVASGLIMWPPVSGDARTTTYRGDYTFTGLNLAEGRTYYGKLKVVDWAGLTNIASTDGVLVAPTAPSLPGALTLASTLSPPYSSLLTSVTLAWPQPVHLAASLRSLAVSVAVDSCAGAATASATVATRLADGLVLASAATLGQANAASPYASASRVLATVSSAPGSTTSAANLTAITLHGLSMISTRNYFATMTMTSLAGTKTTVCSQAMKADATPPTFSGTVRFANGETHNDATRGGAVWAQPSRTAVSLAWDACADADSGISSYEVALGTAAWASDVAPWTTMGGVDARAGTVTLPSPMRYDQPYFATLKCTSSAGASTFVSSAPMYVARPVTDFSVAFDATAEMTVGDRTLAGNANRTHAFVRMTAVTRDAAVLSARVTLGPSCNTQAWGALELPANSPVLSAATVDAAGWSTVATVALPAGGVPTGSPVYGTACLRLINGPFCACTEKAMLVDATTPANVVIGFGTRVATLRSTAAATHIPVFWDNAADAESGLYTRALVEIISLPPVASHYASATFTSLPSSGSYDFLLAAGLPSDTYHLRMTLTNAAGVEVTVEAPDVLVVDTLGATAGTVVTDHPSAASNVASGWLHEDQLFLSWSGIEAQGPSGIDSYEYSLVRTTSDKMGQTLPALALPAAVFNTPDLIFDYVNAGLSTWAVVSEPAGGLANGECYAAVVRAWTKTHVASLSSSPVVCLDRAAPVVTLTGVPSVVAPTVTSIPAHWDVSAPTYGIAAIHLYIGTTPGAQDKVDPTVPSGLALGPITAPTKHAADATFALPIEAAALTSAQTDDWPLYVTLRATTWAGITWRTSSVLYVATAPQAPRLVGLRLPTTGSAADGRLWAQSTSQATVGWLPATDGHGTVDSYEVAVTSDLTATDSTLADSDWHSVPAATTTYTHTEGSPVVSADAPDTWLVFVRAVNSFGVKSEAASATIAVASAAPTLTGLRGGHHPTLSSHCIAAYANSPLRQGTGEFFQTQIELQWSCTDAVTTTRSIVYLTQNASDTLENGFDVGASNVFQYTTPTPLVPGSSLYAHVMCANAAGLSVLSDPYRLEVPTVHSTERLLLVDAVDPANWTRVAEGMEAASFAQAATAEMCIRVSFAFPNVGCTPAFTNAVWAIGTTPLAANILAATPLDADMLAQAWSGAPFVICANASTTPVTLTPGTVYYAAVSLADASPAVEASTQGVLVDGALSIPALDVALLPRGPAVVVRFTLPAGVAHATATTAATSTLSFSLGTSSGLRDVLPWTSFPGSDLDAGRLVYEVTIPAADWLAAPTPAGGLWYPAVHVVTTSGQVATLDSTVGHKFGETRVPLVTVGRTAPGFHTFWLGDDIDVGYSIRWTDEFVCETCLVPIVSSYQVAIGTSLATPTSLAGWTTIDDPSQRSHMFPMVDIQSVVQGTAYHAYVAAVFQDGTRMTAESPVFRVASSAPTFSVVGWPDAVGETPYLGLGQVMPKTTIAADDYAHTHMHYAWALGTAPGLQDLMSLRPLRLASPSLAPLLNREGTILYPTYCAYGAANVATCTSPAAKALAPQLADVTAHARVLLMEEVETDSAKVWRQGVHAVDHDTTTSLSLLASVAVPDGATVTGTYSAGWAPHGTDIKTATALDFAQAMSVDVPTTITEAHTVMYITIHLVYSSADHYHVLPIRLLPPVAAPAGITARMVEAESTQPSVRVQWQPAEGDANGVVAYHVVLRDGDNTIVGQTTLPVPTPGPLTASASDAERLAVMTAPRAPAEATVALTAPMSPAATYTASVESLNMASLSASSSAEFFAWPAPAFDSASIGTSMSDEPPYFINSPDSFDAAWETSAGNNNPVLYVLLSLGSTEGATDIMPPTLFWGHMDNTIYTSTKLVHRQIVYPSLTAYARHGQRASVHLPPVLVDLSGPPLSVIVEKAVLTNTSVLIAFNAATDPESDLAAAMLSLLPGSLDADPLFEITINNQGERLIATSDEPLRFAFTATLDPTTPYFVALTMASGAGRIAQWTSDMLFVSSVPTAPATAPAIWLGGDSPADALSAAAAAPLSSTSASSSLVVEPVVARFAACTGSALSPVTSYQVAVGNASVAALYVPWTSVDAAQRQFVLEGLVLPAGTTSFALSVKCADAAGFTASFSATFAVHTVTGVATLHLPTGASTPSGLASSVSVVTNSPLKATVYANATAGIAWDAAFTAPFASRGVATLCFTSDASCAETPLLLGVDCVRLSVGLATSTPASTTVAPATVYAALPRTVMTAPAGRDGPLYACLSMDSPATTYERHVYRTPALDMASVLAPAKPVLSIVSARYQSAASTACTVVLRVSGWSSTQPSRLQLGTSRPATSNLLDTALPSSSVTLSDDVSGTVLMQVTLTAVPVGAEVFASLVNAVTGEVAMAGPMGVAPVAPEMPTLVILSTGTTRGPFTSSSALRTDSLPDIYLDDATAPIAFAFGPAATETLVAAALAPERARVIASLSEATSARATLTSLDGFQWAVYASRDVMSAAPAVVPWTRVGMAGRTWAQNVAGLSDATLTRDASWLLQRHLWLHTPLVSGSSPVLCVRALAQGPTPATPVAGSPRCVRLVVANATAVANVPKCDSLVDPWVSTPNSIPAQWSSCLAAASTALAAVGPVVGATLCADWDDENAGTAGMPRCLSLTPARLSFGHATLSSLSLVSARPVRVTLSLRFPGFSAPAATWTAVTRLDEKAPEVATVEWSGEGVVVKGGKVYGAGEGEVNVTIGDMQEVSTIKVAELRIGSAAGLSDLVNSVDITGALAAIPVGKTIATVSSGLTKEQVGEAREVVATVKMCDAMGQCREKSSAPLLIAPASPILAFTPSTRQGAAMLWPTALSPSGVALLQSETGAIVVDLSQNAGLQNATSPSSRAAAPVSSISWTLSVGAEATPASPVLASGIWNVPEEAFATPDAALAFQATVALPSCQWSTLCLAAISLTNHTSTPLCAPLIACPSRPVFSSSPSSLCPSSLCDVSLSSRSLLPTSPSSLLPSSRTPISADSLTISGPRPEMPLYAVESTLVLASALASAPESPVDSLPAVAWEWNNTASGVPVSGAWVAVVREAMEEASYQGVMAVREGGKRTMLEEAVTEQVQGVMEWDEEKVRDAAEAVVAAVNGVELVSLRPASLPPTGSLIVHPHHDLVPASGYLYRSVVVMADALGRAAAAVSKGVAVVDEEQSDKPTVVMPADPDMASLHVASLVTLGSDLASSPSEAPLRVHGGSTVVIAFRREGSAAFGHPDVFAPATSSRFVDASPLLSSLYPAATWCKSRPLGVRSPVNAATVVAGASPLSQIEIAVGLVSESGRPSLVPWTHAEPFLSTLTCTSSSLGVLALNLGDLTGLGAQIRVMARVTDAVGVRTEEELSSEAFVLDLTAPQAGEVHVGTDKDVNAAWTDATPSAVCAQWGPELAWVDPETITLSYETAFVMLGGYGVAPPPATMNEAGPGDEYARDEEVMREVVEGMKNVAQGEMSVTLPSGVSLSLPWLAVNANDSAAFRTCRPLAFAHNTTVCALVRATNPVGLRSSAISARCLRVDTDAPTAVNVSVLVGTQNGAAATIWAPTDWISFTWDAFTPSWSGLHAYEYALFDIPAALARVSTQVADGTMLQDWTRVSEVTRLAKTASVDGRWLAASLLEGHRYIPCIRAISRAGVTSAPVCGSGAIIAGAELPVDTTSAGTIVFDDIAATAPTSKSVRSALVIPASAFTEPATVRVVASRATSPAHAMPETAVAPFPTAPMRFAAYGFRMRIKPTNTTAAANGASTDYVFGAPVTVSLTFTNPIHDAPYEPFLLMFNGTSGQYVDAAATCATPRTRYDVMTGLLEVDVCSLAGDPSEAANDGTTLSDFAVVAPKQNITFANVPTARTVVECPYTLPLELLFTPDAAAGLTVAFTDTPWQQTSSTTRMSCSATTTRSYVLTTFFGTPAGIRGRTTQNLQVVDRTAPYFEMPTDPLAVSCDVDLTDEWFWTQVPEIQECQTTYTKYFTVEYTDVNKTCPGTATITYRTSDPCGNMATYTRKVVIYNPVTLSLTSVLVGSIVGVLGGCLVISLIVICAIRIDRHRRAKQQFRAAEAGRVFQATELVETHAGMLARLASVMERMETLGAKLAVPMTAGAPDAHDALAKAPNLPGFRPPTPATAAPPARARPRRPAASDPFSDLAAAVSGDGLAQMEMQPIGPVETPMQKRVREALAERVASARSVLLGVDAPVESTPLTVASTPAASSRESPPHPFVRFPAINAMAAATTPAPPTPPRTPARSSLPRGVTPLANGTVLIASPAQLAAASRATVPVPAPPAAPVVTAADLVPVDPLATAPVPAPLPLPLGPPPAAVRPPRAPSVTVDSAVDDFLAAASVARAPSAAHARPPSGMGAIEEMMAVMEEGALAGPVATGAEEGAGVTAGQATEWRVGSPDVDELVAQANLPAPPPAPDM